MQELDRWLASHCGPQAYVVRKAWEGPNGMMAVYQLVEYQIVFLAVLVEGESTQIPYDHEARALHDAEMIAAFAGAQELI